MLLNHHIGSGEVGFSHVRDIKCLEEQGDRGLRVAKRIGICLTKLEAATSLFMRDTKTHAEYEEKKLTAKGQKVDLMQSMDSSWKAFLSFNRGDFPTSIQRLVELRIVICL